MPGFCRARAEAVLIAFSSAPQVIPGLSDLPEPSGGTALHSALTLCASFRPRHTLIVSDGQPDDAPAALSAADALPGQIDVIYVGPDNDADAMAFMRKLARLGGGRVVVHDMKKNNARQPGPPAQLAQAIRGLLPAPGGNP